MDTLIITSLEKLMNKNIDKSILTSDEKVINSLLACRSAIMLKYAGDGQIYNRKLLNDITFRDYISGNVVQASTIERYQVDILNFITYEIDTLLDTYLVANEALMGFKDEIKKLLSCRKLDEETYQYIQTDVVAKKVGFKWSCYLDNYSDIIATTGDIKVVTQMLLEDTLLCNTLISVFSPNREGLTVEKTSLIKISKDMEGLRTVLVVDVSSIDISKLDIIMGRFNDSFCKFNYIHVIEDDRESITWTGTKAIRSPKMINHRITEYQDQIKYITNICKSFRDHIKVYVLTNNHNISKAVLQQKKEPQNNKKDLSVEVITTDNTLSLNNRVHLIK